MIISLVPKEHVIELWPRIEKFIAEATEYNNGRYETEDVLDLIVDYGYLLWIAFTEENDIKGIVITSFSVYPRKKYLTLDFCGGEDGFEWKNEMLKTLRSWAKDSKCDGIEGAGRAGWERIFKEDGYTKYLQNFELSM
jgi:hypothetical protein